MAEPDWLELAWKLSGSGMSKTRFAEVYADKIDKVPAGSHSAKAAVAALALAPDQTNAEVSDERLREMELCPFCNGEVTHVGSWAKSFKPPILYIEYHHDCAMFPHRVWSFPASSELHSAFVAAWNRRSGTSQASEGETSLPRMDDIAAASIKYICADCAREESEYSCHSIEDVVIINDEVICLDHAKELHAGQQRRKAPDVAAKLRRQRMSIATYQKAAENAPVPKRVERLETALKPFARAAVSLDIIEDESAIIWGGDGRPENFIQVRHFRAARQALQGGRS